MKIRLNASSDGGPLAACGISCRGPSRRFVWIALATAPLLAALTASAADDHASGSLAVRESEPAGTLEIVDGGRRVLRYHNQLVSEPPGFAERVAPGARKYAVPRCDYIHPLYGLGGEVLTEDWASDHPHHRGIYWAWPEVEWQGQQGDLHALQQVFARPTGKTRVESGPDFVQIIAEHEWQWGESRTPIVREQAVIRAYRRTAIGRAIDLAFRFVALDAEVRVARREQTHYGGLNVRLGPATDQEIVTFTDPADASPRRAWSHRTGTPGGGDAVTALTVLQALTNPSYPGDWVQFPNLSWVQPTFPAAGTRHAITKDRPLELRYRLWIHEGKQSPQVLHALWSDYQADLHPAQEQELDRTFQAVLTYQTGESRDALGAVEALVRGSRAETRARCESRLIGILREPAATADAKDFALRQLALIGTETCVPAVAAYLTDSRLAHAARYALLPIRGEPVDQALRTALKQATGGAQVGLILLLGQRRDRQAVALLIPLLRSSDTETVRAAGVALGQIGSAEAAQALSESCPQRAVLDAWRDARLACAEQLAATGKTTEALDLYRREYAAPEKSSHVRIAALAGIVKLDKDKALAEVLGGATGSDARVARAAAAMLPLVTDPRAVRAMAELLATAPPDMQVVFLGQLAARGDRSVAADVARCLASEHPEVAQAAAVALGAVGQAEQVGPLVASAAGPGPVAAIALQSLTQLNAPGVDAEILRRLQESDDKQRLILIRTSNRRRLTAAVPALLTLAEKGPPGLRPEAIQALAGLVDEQSLTSLVKLLAAADSTSQATLVEATVTACKRLQKPGDVLLDALAGASPAGRSAVLTAIGPLGGDKALQAVTDASADADTGVQDAAILTLGRWPDRAALPALLRLVGSLPAGPRQTAAVRASTGLLERVDLPLDEKTQHCATLLATASRPEEKRLLLAALSRIKCPEALKLAGSLLADEQIGGEAAAAVMTIALPTKAGHPGLSGAPVVVWLTKARPLVPEAARPSIDQYLAELPQPDSLNLAVGRPVQTSVPHQGTLRPELAVDGKMTPPSFWSGEKTPAWLSVDLGRRVKINQVLAIFYWDGRRYYQYTVDVSRDGQEWQTVADQSQNKAVSTPKGFAHTFEPVEARYVRIHILVNSANPGAHIVEVKVYAAP